MKPIEKRYIMLPIVFVLINGTIGWMAGMFAISLTYNSLHCPYSYFGFGSCISPLGVILFAGLQVVACSVIWSKFKKLQTTLGATLGPWCMCMVVTIAFALGYDTFWSYVNNFAYVTDSNDVYALVWLSNTLQCTASMYLFFSASFPLFMLNIPLWSALSGERPGHNGA